MNALEVQNDAVRVADLFGETRIFQRCSIKAVDLSGGHVILERKGDD